jgi:cellulose synthase (UDP-forming)
MRSGKADFLKGKTSRRLIAFNLLLATIYFYVIAFRFVPGNHLLFGLLIAGEAFHLLQTFGYCYTIWTRKNSSKPRGVFTKPVDIFITVCGEPLDIIEQTILQAKTINYVNKHIYVLNDGYVAHKSNWQAVDKLAKRLDVKCITRRIAGGAKAGNLNNALRLTNSPFVAVFDADHVPHRGFLSRMMGYFHNENVGYVQSPQYYRNQQLNSVTRAAWRQQTLFFGPIMRGKNHLNAAFMCGTNMVFRRTAVDEVGGMNEQNIVEDFVTSLDVQSKGWRGVYVPAVLAEGLAPEDFLSYYRQQYRWSRGSLDVLLRRNILFRAGLTLAQRLQYFISALYYISGIVVLIDALLPLIYLYSGMIAVNTRSMTLAAIFLPTIFFNLYTLQISNGFSYDFTAISFSVSSFGIQLSALVATLFNKQSKFIVTPKRQVNGKFNKYVLPHITYIGLSLIGIPIALARSGLSASLLANVAWVMVNAICFTPFIMAATGWQLHFWQIKKLSKIKFKMTDKFKIALVFSGCVLSICLTSYFLLIHASVRLDESQSLIQVHRSIPGLLHVVALDVHVPLYHIMLHYWQMAFGYSIQTARVMSLIIFLLMLPYVYLLARRLFSVNASLFATVLVSISPFMNWYGNEARMYTLLALVCVANQYYFLGILQRNKGWRGYILSGLLGIYSHYFFCVYLLVQFIYIAINCRALGLDRIKRFAGVYFVLLAAFAPWLYFFHTLGSGSSENPLLSHPSTVDLFNVFSQFSFGFQDNFVNTILVSCWPFLLALALLAVKQRQKLTPSLKYIFLSAFMPVIIIYTASVFIKPLLVSRYLIMCLVPCTLIVIWLLVNYSGRAARLGCIIIFVVVCVTAAQEYISPATPVKEDYRDAVQYINKNATSADEVVLTAPFTIYPVDYYYHSSAVIRLLPDSAIKPLHGSQASTAPLNTQIKAVVPNHSAKVYLLASYNQGQEKKIVGYFKLHYRLTYSRYYSHDLNLYVFYVNKQKVAEERMS